MVIFLESEAHYRSLGLYESGEEYFGAYKLLFGKIKLSECSVIVYTLEHSFLNFVIVSRARQLGIKVVLVVDGVFEWFNSYKNRKLKGKPLFHPRLYDAVYICCNELTRQYILLGGGEVKKFYNPRVFGKIREACMRDNPVEFDFVVTTAKTAYFDEQEKKRLITLMNHIKVCLDSGGYSYVTRIFDEDLLAKSGFDKEKNKIDGTYCAVASRSRCVLTTPSSISIESMVMGLRVGHILVRDAPVTVPAAWNFHGSIDIAETLIDMSTTEHNYRDDFQLSILKNFSEDVIDPSKLMEELKKVENDRMKFQKSYSLLERMDFIWRLPYEAFVKGNRFFRVKKR